MTKQNSTELVVITETLCFGVFVKYKIYETDISNEPSKINRTKF